MDSFVTHKMIACVDVLSLLLPFKDLFFLVIGGYIGFVATNYFHWLAVKHELFSQVSLLTAFLTEESKEPKAEPYPMYRTLENRALELLYHGHDNAYEVCHAIANRMEEMFRRVDAHLRVKQNDYVDLTQYKTEWLKLLLNLEPNWCALFWFKRRSVEVMESYTSKETDYVANRRHNLSKCGKNEIKITDL